MPEDLVALEVHRLTPGRERDFFRLHCAANGCGWCRCAAWWVPTWEGWGERSVEQNETLRRELFARGEHDGYLGYLDGEPVAWCQAGPRDRLRKAVEQFSLEADPDTWAVSCFLVHPAHRRRGLATVLLRSVLADLRERGARRVEVFPKRSEEADELDLWNGPEAMFRGEGFQVVRDDPVRPVLARAL